MKKGFITVALVGLFVSALTLLVARPVHADAFGLANGTYDFLIVGSNVLHGSGQITVANGFLSSFNISITAPYAATFSDTCTQGASSGAETFCPGGGNTTQNDGDFLRTFSVTDVLGDGQILTFQTVNHGLGDYVQHFPAVYDANWEATLVPTVPAPVPEPSTLLLLSFGLVGLLGLRYRKGTA